MGCDTCKSECGREDGCGTRKATQKVVLDGLAARLYPSRTWGLADDEACFRAGLSLTEVQRLGRQVAAVVNFPPKQIGKFMSEVLCLGFPDRNGKVVLLNVDRAAPDGGRLF